MTILFSPPSVNDGAAYRADADIVTRKLWGHFARHNTGVTVLKTGGTYVEQQYVYHDDLVAADLYYQGGHIYEVDQDEADALIEAGFGDGISGYPSVEGPFTIDFSLYPDGPVPAEAMLRDAFLDDPDNQDEMGVRDGKLAVVEFRGPDQSFIDGGGRRGYLWRNTLTLTDNVYGPIDVPDGGAAGNVGSAPVLHVNTETEWQGISAWFVPAPFSWTELGVMGQQQSDFSYLDLHPGTSMPSPGDDIKLRSVGGMVALEVNGETVCGPCEIPADLLGSAVHGVQMDVADDMDEAVGIGYGVTIDTDPTPLGTRSAPLTPALGAAVETASSTTIDVPYPAGIAVGNTLYCIVLTRNGGTISASGWTDVPTSFGGVLNTSIRVIRKTADGGESGTLTVTKNTAGVMAATMVRVTGDQSASSMYGQFNSSASTSLPSPAIQIFGPYRTALWIAGTSIDTDITVPSGFFPISAGVSGGQAVRLAVGVVILDTHPDLPDPPIFNAYASSHFPAQVGTAASSTTSAVGLLVLHPAVGT